MCSTSSARWCGLPPSPPRPLRCGVVVYLHVPKTGGTAVTQFLHQQATGGRNSWWSTTVNEQNTWASIVARMQQQQRPRQIVIHHVDTHVALSNATLQRAFIKPLECWLRGKGCRLVITTTLREAASRATSAAFYNRVPHERYSEWVAEHASNGMTSFLLYNRLRLRRQNRTLPMTKQSLGHAEAFLSGMHAVGRTEELTAYLAYMHHLLNGNSSSSALSSQVSRENATPERFKYGLTAEEQAWTRERTMLDQQLYESFCSDACPMRHPEPRQPLEPCS